MQEEHYSSPEISEVEELARVDREFLEKINSLKKRRAFIDFVKKIL